MLIYNMFKKMVKFHNNIPAICVGEKSISYSDVLAETDKLIGYFVKSGVKHGERIAVYAHHSPKLLYLYLAASRLGLKIIFLYDLYEPTRHEFQALLNEAMPDWVITDETIKDAAFSDFALDRYLHFSVADAFQSEMPDLSDFNKSNFFSGFIQVYTSGTTGKPKEVCLTEIALYIQARQIAQKMQIDFHSHVLLNGFMYNTTGLPLSTAVLMHGGTLFFKSYHDVKDIFAEVEQKRISHFMLQPYGIARALLDEKIPQRDLKCLKLIAYGAAAMPTSLLELARKKIPCQWLQGYGLTETCGPVVWLDEMGHKCKQGSVGKTAGETDIVIVADDGEYATCREIGEIAIKGPTVMLGYWDKTLKQPDSGSLKNGWFYTGDLGYLDEDGYLFLVGRKKDCIVTANGFTIYPKEVEDVLQEFDYVDESSVVGLKNDLGEYPVAFVKSTQSFELSELKRFLLQRISALKFPHYIVTTNKPLPRNLNGKINKQALRDELDDLVGTEKLAVF